jgi:hypothetical protein
VLKIRADRLKLFAVIAVSYGMFYSANNYATQFLYLEPAAHIIHLPSGVRMFLVLVAGTIGASAVALATFPYVYLGMFNHDLPLSVVSSIATGLIPLISFFLIRRFIQLRPDFSNLTIQKLFTISVTYSVINSVCQQLIMMLFGQAQQPLNGVLVMFTGDILGIIIVAYLLRLLAILIWKKRRKKPL